MDSQDHVNKRFIEKLVNEYNKYIPNHSINLDFDYSNNDMLFNFIKEYIIILNSSSENINISIKIIKKTINIFTIYQINALIDELNSFIRNNDNIDHGIILQLINQNPNLYNDTIILFSVICKKCNNTIKFFGDYMEDVIAPSICYICNSRELYKNDEYSSYECQNNEIKKCCNIS